MEESASHRANTISSPKRSHQQDTQTVTQINNQLNDHEHEDHKEENNVPRNLDIESMPMSINVNTAVLNNDQVEKVTLPLEKTQDEKEKALESMKVINNIKNRLEEFTQNTNSANIQPESFKIPQEHLMNIQNFVLNSNLTSQEILQTLLGDDLRTGNTTFDIRNFEIPSASSESSEEMKDESSHAESSDVNDDEGNDDQV